MICLIRQDIIILIRENTNPVKVRDEGCGKKIFEMDWRQGRLYRG